MQFLNLHYFSLALFIVIVLLQAADGYLTWRIILGGGDERNPVMAFLMLSIGTWPALALAKLALVILVYVFLLARPWLLLGVILVYLCIIAHNWRQLHTGDAA